MREELGEEDEREGSRTFGCGSLVEGEGSRRCQVVVVVVVVEGGVLGWVWGKRRARRWRGIFG